MTKGSDGDLNDLQRQAVDSIDGPLLVIAGPGTGKTQLLSYRVANILKEGGVLPANILCLTFTDNAAENMRDRLKKVIGQSAYHVAIHTFHSFGSEIINQYPDFFTDRPMLQQIDELGRYEIVHAIFEDLPHKNPLSTRAGSDFVFLKDTLDIISWLKQNALTPAELRDILTSNQKVLDKLNKIVSDVFAGTPSPKHLNNYNKLLKAIENDKQEPLYGFDSYANACAGELADAIDQTDPRGRYAPRITEWRNNWCTKGSDGLHHFKDQGRNLQKMLAVGDIYEELIKRMSEQALFDFDDMIIESVHALEKNKELLYSLQERFLFIMVDEFQDTNKAQLRILKALGDNPVNEGKPNIMAVGDDDQAIYAFQGAEASNMTAFLNLYKESKLITLTDNYRSTERILSAGEAIANQVSDRLSVNDKPIDKKLIAKEDHALDTVEHDLFISELAQYDFISEKIKEYIDAGLQPEQIAVIAPRHKYLERLMPYLGNLKVPVAYERRENILDSPIIIQLLTMSSLIIAIDKNNHHETDALLSEVLGYDFLDCDPAAVLNLSLEAYDTHDHWLKLLIKSKDTRLKTVGQWFMDLARVSKLEPLEYILDKLMGDSDENGHDDEFDDILLPKSKTEIKFNSPMRSFYFNKDHYDEATDAYLTLLGQLSTLRQRLRGFRPNKTLYASDLVEFVGLHRAAHIKIIDSSPHTQTTNAIQVMTAYKAKGLEFEVVFLINTQDEVWGPTAKNKNSKVKLPANLTIAPPRDNLNDQLRLFFVSLTRARSCLIITSYENNLDNKASQPLSFLFNDNTEYLSPDFKPKTHDKPATLQAAQILTTDWAYKFRQIVADKPALFEPIFKNYQLSVTHLNNFLDVTKDGPNYFLSHNLLRFPEAISPAAAYGDAIHKTLEWAHLELKRLNKLPGSSAINTYFSDILDKKHLREADFKRLNKRGEEALNKYLRGRPNSLRPNDTIERKFKNEGVVVGDAHLSGNIDMIHYITPSEVEVVDFKTGSPSLNWYGKDDYEKLKLHKYRQQLLFYKLLIENSASYKGKLFVTGGSLEFIEADDNGYLVKNLEMEFKKDEIDRFVRLIGVVWQHITGLNFPDISQYKTNLSGVIQFENDLLEGKI